MRTARIMLWKNTKRRIGPSWPCCCVAAAATTMLWASIILPITPPELFAAAINTGLTPVCSAVILCNAVHAVLAKSAG